MQSSTFIYRSIAYLILYLLSTNLTNQVFYVRASLDSNSTPATNKQSESIWNTITSLWNNLSCVNDCHIEKTLKLDRLKKENRTLIYQRNERTDNRNIPNTLSSPVENQINDEVFIKNERMPQNLIYDNNKQITDYFTKVISKPILSIIFNYLELEDLQLLTFTNRHLYNILTNTTLQKSITFILNFEALLTQPQKIIYNLLRITKKALPNLEKDRQMSKYTELLDAYIYVYNHPWKNDTHEIPDSIIKYYLNFVRKKVYKNHFVDSSTEKIYFPTGKKNVALLHSTDVSQIHCTVFQKAHIIYNVRLKQLIQSEKVLVQDFDLPWIFILSLSLYGSEDEFLFNPNENDNIQILALKQRDSIDYVDHVRLTYDFNKDRSLSIDWIRSACNIVEYTAELKIQHHRYLLNIKPIFININWNNDE